MTGGKQSQLLVPTDLDCKTGLEFDNNKAFIFHRVVPAADNLLKNLPKFQFSFRSSYHSNRHFDTELPHRKTEEELLVVEIFLLHRGKILIYHLLVSQRI